MRRPAWCGRSAGSLQESITWAAAFCLLLLSATATAASLSEAAQQHIRAATFEVVQLKPPEGAVQYERPLPLDLIPYQQRFDKYRSIGTAFAIGPNRFVTAAHVLTLGAGSQYGPPALRDSAGKVYDIDQVLEFSDHKDFAIFSLREPPAMVPTLAFGPHPMLNDPVFAVGNALGEGIVIRDGSYTSDTPEELAGAWKWLRFSAAASPGNSGGPLVDEQGRVVGIILRKTEAENLNYALPIEVMSASPEGLGRLRSRAAMRLAFLDAAGTLDIDEQFRLPLALGDFYDTLRKLTDKDVLQTRAKLLADHSGQLFPNGDGSDALLLQVPNSPLPRPLHRNPDGTWAVVQTRPRLFQLDDNGTLRVAGNAVRLQAPDNIALATLYGDSKLLMDLVLKGFPVRRKIGNDSINVTSLGKAQELGTYTDHYGRVWQVRSWQIPFADVALSALCLPTPEGYDLILAPAPTRFRQLAIDGAELSTDYLYLTLTATLSRWREYLAIPDVQPKVFGTFTLQVDPDRYVRFQSQHFDLQVTPKLVKFDKDAQLVLALAYFRDGGTVTWNVGAVTVQEGLQRADWVRVARLAAPAASLPQSFQDTWLKAQQHQFPFNSAIISGNAATRIVAVMPAAATGTAAPAVDYVLTADDAGQQSQRAMARKLALLRRSVRVPGS